MKFVGIGKLRRFWRFFDPHRSIECYGTRRWLEPHTHHKWVDDFAPTNDAFEAVGFDIDLLMEEEIAVLRDILLYHVSFAGLMPFALALLTWLEPMANGHEDPND